MSESKSVKQELSILSPQIDLEQLKQHRSYLELTRLSQNTGADNVVIGLASGNTSQFDVPAAAFNPAQSILDFTATIPLEAAKYTYMPRDTFPCIDSIQVQTSKGLNLLDHRFAPQYSKAISKLECSYQKLQTGKKEGLLQVCNARPSFSVTDGKVVHISDSKECYVSTSNGGATDAKVDGTTNAVQFTAADVSAYRYNGDQVDNAYTENLYVVRSDYGAALTVRFKLPLADLVPSSILSKDQTLYVGEPLRVILNWSQGLNWGWTGTSATNPATGAAAITTVPTITLLRLYVAQERNENIIATLQSKFEAGTLNYLIPYPQSYKNSLDSATSHNVTIRTNMSQGLRLRRIIHSIISGTEEKNNRYEITRIDNTGASIAGSYYTMVDNRRRQQFNVDMSDGKDEDYMLMYPHLKGSAIQSRDSFKYNWVHVEAFDELGSVADRSAYDENIQKGISLTSGRELKWDFSLTLSAAEALKHYTFCIFERNLNPTPRGVMLDGLLG
jgi:hypothetical protein